MSRIDSAISSGETEDFNARSTRPANRQVQRFSAMAAAMKDSVLGAAATGNVDALRQLVSEAGASAVRLDDDPLELTTLHWAAAAGQMAAVEYLLSPAVGPDPRAARNNILRAVQNEAVNPRLTRGRRPGRRVSRTKKPGLWPRVKQFKPGSSEFGMARHHFKPRGV